MRRVDPEPALPSLASAVNSPRFNRPLGIRKADEAALVQAFVPERPVKALDGGVPDRLPGVDEVEHDLVVMGTLVQRCAHELGPVAAHNRARIAAHGRVALEDADHALPRVPDIDLNPGTRPRAVVHEGEEAERPPVAERVAHENTPPLVRARRHRQPLLLGHAVDLLSVDPPAFAAQHPRRLSIALAPPS